MKTKDIILQVSEETAGIMEEISNQMFDETDERFEEVNQLIKTVISIVESFVEEFEEYITQSKKKFAGNKDEFINEFEKIKERFICLQQNYDKETQNIRDYNDKLLESYEELKGIIQEILDYSSISNSGIIESKEIFKQGFFDISGNISEIENKIKFVESRMEEYSISETEKIEELIDAISKIDNIISGDSVSLNSTLEKLNSCLGLLKNVSEYTGTIEKRSEDIYGIEQGNIEKLEKVIEEEQQIKELFQELEVSVVGIDEKIINEIENLSKVEKIVKCVESKIEMYSMIVPEKIGDLRDTILTVENIISANRECMDNTSEKLNSCWTLLKNVSEHTETIEKRSDDIYGIEQGNSEKLEKVINEEQQIKELFQELEVSVVGIDEKIINEFENIKERFICLQQNYDKETQNTRGYSDKLLEVYEQLKGIIQEILNYSSTSNSGIIESKDIIRESFFNISENLSEVKDMVKSVENKMEGYAIPEKIKYLVDTISKIENMILGSRKIVDSTSEKLNSCWGLLENVSENTVAIEKHGEEIYGIEKGNTEKIEKVLEEEQKIKELFQVVEDAIGELSSSVDKISAQQNEIMEKQDKLEKDLEYLKLPFYKKWFWKGN